MDSIDINKIKYGDEIAFKNFFAYFYPKMMALARRFVSEQVAKDLVHDTFTIYWERKEQIDVQNLHSFLFKCLQNSCLNYLKHQTVVAEYEAEVQIAKARIDYLCENTDYNTVFKQIQDRNLHEVIEASVDKLPPRTAEAFRLCYYHDLSHKEIANVMKISPRTVETHIRQAILFLREDLKDISLFYAILSLFLEKNPFLNT